MIRNSERARGRIPRILRLPLVFLLSAFLAGCHRGARVEAPLPPDAPEHPSFDNTVAAATMEWLPPAVPVVEPPADNESVRPAEPAVVPGARDGKSPGKEAPSGPAAAAPSVDNAPAGRIPTSPADAQAAPGKAATPPARGITETGSAESGTGAGRKNERKMPLEGPPRKAVHGEASPSSAREKHNVAPQAAAAPSMGAHAPSLPGWARRPEELVYRVDFIGITMGYARFRYEGKVTIGGKTAYHLNVRAWTSGALAYIYPVNETIDYYLDEETLAPIRQEFTQREREKDDVATYDQDSGTITYRYRLTGEIRKRVVTVPTVYDPVSVAYYFRWRDLGAEDRPRNVYAGRKVWQISARLLGNERIRTEHGEIDAIAVRPVIRKDGKVQDKGDLKIWFSGDDRRVPVRLYAKFRKIKDWTLVGELMPSGARAGG